MKTWTKTKSYASGARIILIKSGYTMRPIRQRTKLPFLNLNVNTLLPIKRKLQGINSLGRKLNILNGAAKYYLSWAVVVCVAALVIVVSCALTISTVVAIKNYVKYLGYAISNMYSNILVSIKFFATTVTGLSAMSVMKSGSQ